MSDKSAILCILDGWGIAQESHGNPIALTHPKTFEYLSKNFPHSQLIAHGPAVGLPENQEGNSETGHLNIGAGRIVYQDLALINMSIADGSFFTNPQLLETVKHLNSFHSRLHLIGMIGNSGVHAYNEHLYALLMFAKHHHIRHVYLHLITDGRDSPPDDGLNQISKVVKETNRYDVGRIVSLMGRYYALDRDLRLDRTQKAFDCIVGNNTPNHPEAFAYLQDSYNEGVYDEFVLPSTLGPEPANTRVCAGDAAIFFNFRTDRPRQLTKMFLESGIPNLHFVTMTKYQADFQNPCLFPTNIVTDTLGEIISQNHFAQLRAAETEKIAMVSYYFNGQNEKSFPDEKHLFVPSPKVATYDLQPQMSTDELTRQFILENQTSSYKLSVINYASPDMVAHTGNIQATTKAIESCDRALVNLVDLAQKKNAYLVITADHGNAEELLDLKTGKVNTQHSCAPVPLIIYHPTDNQFTLADGKLGDVAPTILDLLELPQPSAMKGLNLISRQSS